MNLKRILGLTLVTVLVAACNHQTPTAPSVNEEAPSSVPSDINPSSVRETPNVSYKGTVRPSRLSIHMEGTHRLELVDGRFILLESQTIDLNGYVGESVELRGAIRPSIEGDSLVMKVQAANLLEDSLPVIPSGDEETTQSASSDTIEEVASSSSAESTTAISSTSSTQSEAPEEATPPATAIRDAGFDGRVLSMAKQDFTPSNWTRQYCSTHIGFCVPVHRNWWYRSFGATSDSVWHIEMNSEDFETLNRGPIAVDVVSGVLADTGHTDAQIIEVDGETVGYRQWSNSQYFVIRADARLHSAVEYITSNLQEAVGE